MPARTHRRGQSQEGGLARRTGLGGEEGGLGLATRSCLGGHQLHDGGTLGDHPLALQTRSYTLV